MILSKQFYVSLFILFFVPELWFGCSEPIKPYVANREGALCLVELGDVEGGRVTCSSARTAILTVDRSNLNHQVVIQLDAADEQPGDLDPASCPTLSKFRPGETYYFRIVKEEHRYLSQEQMWNPEQAVRRPE